jgi:hypothetical protein
MTLIVSWDAFPAGNARPQKCFVRYTTAFDETDETNLGFGAIGTTSVPTRFEASKGGERGSKVMANMRMPLNPVLQNALVLAIAAGLVSSLLRVRLCD